MLSYQHAYHAGCRADVHKHAALAVLLQRLTAKDRPITYMESHAGRGLYDLSSAEAQKTGEADAGILRVLAEGRMPPGHPYRTALDAARQQHGRHAYPGSPWIARTLLRPQDRLHLMELHPQEHAALKAAMDAPGVHIHRRDGLEGVLAIAPPAARAGLVFIDPSYEVKMEYDAVARTVLALHRKWPEATILVWYPLLAAGLHTALRETLERAALPKWRCDEVRFADPATVRGMYGSGLALVNQPYGSDGDLDRVTALFTPA
ncbi:MAG: 23S rRNA (adenine(2030)-N(6))-methyltransferase RlmJ [Alphaproteobacteria bacterium]